MSAEAEEEEEDGVEEFGEAGDRDNRTPVEDGDARVAFDEGVD